MWSLGRSAWKQGTHLFLITLLLFRNYKLVCGQYDNVDYEIADYEEEEVEVDDTQQNINPEPTIFPPAGGQAPVPAQTLFKLPENYSVHKSPPLLDGEPIPVDLSILVFNIFDIKEIQEEISLEVNYKLYWKDLRLSNWTKNIDPGQKFATMSTTLLHRIWHPDIFIDHIKRVTQPQLISPASSLRIYSDGSLRYTSRIILVLTCRMDFHYYPADTQECNVTIKSFAFSTKQIDLRWRDGVGALLAKLIDVQNFDIALVTHPDYLQMTKSNNFSALIFGIHLRRKLSYHLIQTYLPSTLFTIVSWLSFLVPPESTPGRMAICVTTLLTVTAMFGAVKQNTPNVAYIKAMDLWMFLCIVFIFLSLAEFTLVLKLRSMKEKKSKSLKDVDLEKQKAKAKANHKPNENSVGPDASNNSATTPNKPLDAVVVPIPNWASSATVISPPPPPPPAPAPPPAPPAEKGPTKYFLLAAKIEKYAPRIVPVIFLACTCIYWPYLLIGSQYYHLSDDPEMFYNV